MIKFSLLFEIVCFYFFKIINTFNETIAYLFCLIYQVYLYFEKQLNGAIEYGLPGPVSIMNTNDVQQTFMLNAFLCDCWYNVGRYVCIRKLAN